MANKKQAEPQKNRQKGIVFTLDAVFALYVFLILCTTYVLLYETPSPATGEDVLVLSRLARDAYELKYYSGSLPAFAQYQFDANCNNKKYVGSEPAVVYKSGNPPLEIQTVKVCMTNE